MSRASNVEGRNKTFTYSTCGKTFDSQQTLDFHMNRDQSIQPAQVVEVFFTLLNSKSKY